MNPSSRLFVSEPASVAEPFGLLGSQVIAGGVRHRVWAPELPALKLLIENPGALRELRLERDDSGCFYVEDAQGRAGDLYRYLLPDGTPLPDPASRFQPFGVEGPSRVVDPRGHAWRSSHWTRPPMRGRVLYELHVGTFTTAGDYGGAIARLDALADLGVNTIELMPLADFAGARNWGYDGVLPFAPARCYGAPDDLRALVDAAHARGLAVVLDVVYNHLGPCGAVQGRFAPGFFRREGGTLWGPAPDFAEPAVRAYFLQNAAMWLDEYRIDGLRFDATHAIVDESDPGFLSELSLLARERGAFLIAEDERNDARLISPVDEGGQGLDAVWSDDFHHSTRVALTRRREGHYADFSGSSEECARTLGEGWLYTGQHSGHRDGPRGTPAAHRPPEQFVFAISNHDQVGNLPLGECLHDVVSPEAYRALSMLLCLSPYTPMLFMGQEWAAGTPFLFFSDLPGEVGAGVAEGRRREFARYGMRHDPDVLARMPDPQDERTFAASKLDWCERERPPLAEVFALYRACLRLRATTPIFQNPARERWSVEPVGQNLLALRWRDPGGDWLLLVGLEPGLGRLPEHSLLRAGPGRRWRTILASNAPEYGGAGASGSALPRAQGCVITTPGAVLWREA